MKTKAKFLQRQVGTVGNISSVGHFSANLCNVAQGDGDNERVGDRISIKSITAKFIVELGYLTQDINPDGTAVTQQYASGCILRVILFVDKTNFLASMDEVILPYTSTEAQQVMMGYDPDFKKNSIILYDQVHVFNPSAAVNSEQFGYITFRRSFPNGLLLVYDEGVTTPNTNSIKMILVTNITSAASNDIKPDVDSNFRFEYDD
jgi:uncharacterized protein YeaC (DUF1315 family)